MACTVLITNLHAGVDASILEDMFTAVGNVKGARVVYDEYGLSRGIGYVEMATRQEAMDCILYFNGQVNRGQRLVAREDTPHVPKPAVRASRKVLRSLSPSSKGVRR